jgi:hypothetical protein
MPAPVRVRDNVTGHEFTTYAVDEDGRVDEGLTVLKGEAAVDERTGDALPAKPATKPPTAAVPTPGPKATPKES